MARRDIIGLDFREPKQMSTMVAALEALVDDSAPATPVAPVPISVESEPEPESFEIPIQNKSRAVAEGPQAGQLEEVETANSTDA